MKVISTDKAPAAIGPYSQAIDMGTCIFCSGQLPIDPATGQMPADPADQARQSMENVKALLAAAGTSLDKVVKTTVFIKNLEHFGAINEVYASFFSGTFPARSCVEVARLPKDALIEIEVIAVK
ncbi:RidA family protein [Desulfovibrio sp. OttesenSCG-928-G15]|nr:RidA family protein [Desulfovibrio sp. OttesenSCG-928-G15]